MNTIIDIAATTAAATTVSGLGWLQRKAPKSYVGMDGLLDFLKDRSSRAETVNSKNKGIEFHYVEDPQNRDDTNRLAMVVDGQPLEMTHWSFGQLAALAKAPAGYLRGLPAAIVADALTYDLRINRQVEDVKLYHGDNELRAITGPGYGRVHDYQVVEAMQRVLDTGRWVPANRHMGLRATDRSLQMFLIDEAHPIVVGKAPNGSDDVMYRGLRIANSETGHSSLAVDGFFFRSYCLNGMIFGMKEQTRLTIRHSKAAPHRWVREIQPAIEAYADTDGLKLVDAVSAAKEAQVAKDDDAAVAFLQNRKFSAASAKKIIELVKDEEGRNPRTAWDMVQGITAFARSVEGTEERADMERLAGNIWEKATRNAA